MRRREGGPAHARKDRHSRWSWLPAPHRLRESRAIAWLGPALHHPRLWHVSRRGIASGIAIGVFFGMMIPFGQILFAAALAVALRVNLPAAVASTLVTNPVTVAPLYYLAYRLGQLILGNDVPVVTEDTLADSIEGATGWLALWIDRAVTVGRPLLLGSAVVATILAVVANVSVDQLWRAHTLRKWRRRRTGNG